MPLVVQIRPSPSRTLCSFYYILSRLCELYALTVLAFCELRMKTADRKEEIFRNSRISEQASTLIPAKRFTTAKRLVRPGELYQGEQVIQVFQGPAESLGPRFDQPFGGESCLDDDLFRCFLMQETPYREAHIPGGTAASRRSGGCSWGKTNASGRVVSSNWQERLPDTALRHHTRFLVLRSAAARRPFVVLEKAAASHVASMTQGLPFPEGTYFRGGLWHRV